MRFKSYYQSPYQSKVDYHKTLLELFAPQPITELEDERKHVLDIMTKDEWETSPEAFYKSLRKSKHPKMLTDYSVDDLGKMKCYKVPGFNIGFALKNFENKGMSEVVAVHNNESTIKGIGIPIMKAAIKNGGRYLDHFDGELTTLYSKVGFEEYKRDPYNSDYDPNGEFASIYGKKDVIYRKLGNAPIDENNDDEDLGSGFFGEPSQDTAISPTSTSSTVSPEMKASDMRRQVLLKIKSGELDVRHYPVLFSKFIQLMDMTGKITIPSEAETEKKLGYWRGVSTKLTKFIMTGKLGDATTSQSMKSVMNIVKGAAAEIARKLNSDHPNRDMQSLEKRGVIDEIIRFWVKENNYDLFHDEWVNKLYPLIHKEVMNIRKSNYKGNQDI